MRLTWRDAVAGLVAVLLGVEYVVYLVRGSAVLVDDPRSMALVGLVAGAVVMAVGRWWTQREDGAQIAEDTAWVVALVAGVVGLLTTGTTAEVLLAVLMGSVAVAWLLQLGHHAGVVGERHHAPVTR